MAIPVYLQQFKAAGIYRIVYDKTTTTNVDTETLRLVVGYSEKGPFNIAVYVQNAQVFKEYFGGISKKLEKRGIFFHRMALQALSQGPIYVLNLKKFNGETVQGASISTAYDTVFNSIDPVEIHVEDIYDTSRFWELSAEKLNGLKTVDGTSMDQYINICATDTKANSATYFIRKASGSKVSQYNVTVSDWYGDSDEMPDYLQPYLNSKISDFFAEVYVFGGKFTIDQVLASSSLKNYFKIDSTKKDENGNPTLTLKQYVKNAFGESTDTLDALYNDDASNALGHYVGCLIPFFTDKTGSYKALDILFNSDQSIHKLMMSFNTDLLEESEEASIEISGKTRIVVETYDGSGEADKFGTKGVFLSDIFAGNAKTKLLGNVESPVVSDSIVFNTDVINNYIEFKSKSTKISGTMYVSDYDASTDSATITLTQVKKGNKGGDTVVIQCEDEAEMNSLLIKLGAAYLDADGNLVKYTSGRGTFYAAASGEPFSYDEELGIYSIKGPEQVINTIAKVENTDTNNVYTDIDGDMKVSINAVNIITTTHYPSGDNELLVNPADDTSTWSVYGSSVTFIPLTVDTVTGKANWDHDTSDYSLERTRGAYILSAANEASLFSVCQVGDCFLADDNTVDMDGDGEIDEKDGYFDNVWVQDTGTVEVNGNLIYYVHFTGVPYTFAPNDGTGRQFLVRVDAPLNQEIGTMVPQYIEGYTYNNPKPLNTGMSAKLAWQQFILSTLSEYKGLRTGLLNKADIDYRYIVDTFESFPESECKSVLSLLASEKQSAFAILNFPAVKTFTKCPYTSFTDAKGVFNVQYIADGCNSKKAASVKFSLPSESNGASFCAFYTPLKFSDGYIDTIIPSASLVSNLFIEKYKSRQPYYIIAGPNYGGINAYGLVGPDYKYSQDELQVIEPFGVNCMVYRPGFGTFINANQTAKQTPKSALSSVNVRELVIYIQDEIEKVLQAYQWEFNNATTRSAILDKANSICARVQANGGIQAYLNIMDESNNTDEIIDNEMAILSTHIEPGRGCGKMVQELTIYRTGKLSSSISD